MKNIKLQEIITPETFVISDHHFGHAKIGQFEPDRIKKAEELGYETFEDMIIDKHNKTVSENDTVIFLGDFAWGTPAKWIDKLNGRKILILGNHDPKMHSCYSEYEFVVNGLWLDFNDKLFIHKTDDELLSALVMNICGRSVGFCHYSAGYTDSYDRQNSKIAPRSQLIAEFFDENCVSDIFHGHLHSKLAKPEESTLIAVQYYNVSCECVDYTPVKIKDILC